MHMSTDMGTSHAVEADVVVCGGGVAGTMAAVAAARQGASVVLAALKTLELRARRDATVVFFLGFFLVLASFLHSQSLLTALAMGISVWTLLAALVLAHMPEDRPPLTLASAVRPKSWPSPAAATRSTRWGGCFYA